MSRQKSILSFLQKPSPETNTSDDPLRFSWKKSGRIPALQPQVQLSTLADANPTKDPFADEVRGTDTPPEKIPRPSFTSKCPAMVSEDNQSIANPFSSILHKFARNQNDSIPISLLSRSSRLNDNYSHERDELPVDVRINDNDFVCSIDEKAQNVEFDLDLPGPETPTMSRRASNFKRIRNLNYFYTSDFTVLSGSNKRQKENEPFLEKAVQEENIETCNKFEWLNPSIIRDANGRCPSDPLYDQRTLYIPPDVLKKMSASQKQYWSVKCQYMDIILFFKVGKFYELYELDAEIGQKELDWKMTVSGVGKCRQVGISEAGIDDAVEKLIARGYKVGRMEQLETSDQAKVRGKNSVIERKLVHVATPSTVVDGSMGPDAVHLLALKEGESNNGSTVYGFAFLDYAALKFWVGSFIDDGSYAALGALLMQVSPREILYEKSGLTKETHKALLKYASKGLTTTQMTPVVPDVGFLDANEVKKMIDSYKYFRGNYNSWTAAIEAS